MLVEHNRQLHGELFTGPVDSPREEVASEICPHCGHDWLTFTPSQFGQCHGGFATRVLRDHYFCEECCGAFVEDESND